MTRTDMMRQTLQELIDTGRIAESVTFLADNSDHADAAVLDVAFTHLLPRVLATHAAWLVRNPIYIESLLRLCDRALADEYHTPQVVYYVAHLRCYKAVSLVATRQIREAQIELMRAAGKDDRFPDGMNTPVPKKPNSASELGALFGLLFEHLRTHGYEELVSKLDWIVDKALAQIGEDETRVGTTRALLIDGEGRGIVRLVLVALEDGEGIEYQRLSGEDVGRDMVESALAARAAAHFKLVHLGYPEGLSHQRVVWQIARPDGTVEPLKTLYDGASIGLALTLAILSAYLTKVIPGDLAFTGALDLHTANTGEIIGISGAEEKVLAAERAGIRKVYLPLQNEGDLSLAARHSIHGKTEIRPTRSLSIVARDLITADLPSGVGYIFREICRNLLAFVGWSSEATHPVVIKHRAHVLISSLLYCAMFMVEGLILFKVYGHRSSIESAVVVFCSSGAALVCMWISYAVPAALIARRKTNSWYISIALMMLSVIIGWTLLIDIAPTRPLDTAPVYDWPPYLVIFKDLIIFATFGFLFMTNFYNYIVANEFLKERRQFFTLRRSLKADQSALSILPTTLLHIEFRWAVLAAFIAGLILLLGELFYFVQLRKDVPQNIWIISLGLFRDAVFILLAVEVLVWYQISATKLSAVAEKGT